MIINGVTIDATFAEAFPMKATRAIITAQNEKWAMISAQAMTGFATSVIACGCEAGIERTLSPDETPDGRPGVVYHDICHGRQRLGKTTGNPGRAVRVDFADFGLVCRY